MAETLHKEKQGWEVANFVFYGACLVFHSVDDSKERARRVLVGKHLRSKLIFITKLIGKLATKGHTQVVSLLKICLEENGQKLI
jgi:hypothetical protein